MHMNLQLIQLHLLHQAMSDALQYIFLRRAKLHSLLVAGGRVPHHLPSYFMHHHHLHFVLAKERGFHLHST